MGAGESVPLPPWLPPEPGMEYPEEAVERILDLANTADTFLEPHPEAEMPDFSVEGSRQAIEGAMLHDERFSKWLPKLVPRRVEEEAFWRNYFSHVQRVLAGIHPHAAGDGGDDAAAAGLTTESSDGEYQKIDAAAVAAAAGLAPAPPAADAGAEEPWDDRLHPTPQPAVAMDERVGAAAAAAAEAEAEAAAEAEARAEVEAAEAAMGADGLTLSDLELAPEPALPINARDLGRPIRWGIIGCGDVCEIKSGPAFQKAEGSKLVAVMRRTPELARDFARRHGVPKCYTDVDQLVHDPEVDAVYIASPPGTHCELALKVCQAGKPCLVEKPMARHYDECRAMVNAFYRVNLPLYVAYYRRRHDRFVKAKQIVRRFLGRVTSVECVLTRNDHLPAAGGAQKQLGWRVEPEQSGGGLFVDLGSHTLDILDFLLGPLDHVSGDAVSHAAAGAGAGDGGAAVETAVSMTFRTPGGAVGVAVWDFCSAIYQDRLTIKGTKASLIMSVFGSDGPKLFLPSGKSVQYRNTYPEHTHQPLVESIVQQLRGAQVPPERLSTGESAARTAAIVDSVLRKFYRSRNDHFWTRPQTWDNQRQQR